MNHTFSYYCFVSSSVQRFCRYIAYMYCLCSDGSSNNTATQPHIFETNQTNKWTKKTSSRMNRRQRRQRADDNKNCKLTKWRKLKNAKSSSCSSDDGGGAIATSTTQNKFKLARAFSVVIMALCYRFVSLYTNK